MYCDYFPSEDTFYAGMLIKAYNIRIESLLPAV